MTQPTSPRVPKPHELPLLVAMLKATYIHASKQRECRVKQRNERQAMRGVGITPMQLNNSPRLLDDLLTGAKDLEALLFPDGKNPKTIDRILYTSKDIRISALFPSDRMITNTVDIFIKAIGRRLHERRRNVIFSRAQEYLEALKVEMRKPKAGTSKAANRSNAKKSRLLECLKTEIHLQFPAEASGYFGVAQQSNCLGF